jgi:dihydroflavonol-4-reductase
MARVLVTGATGFIGRHLVRHLLSRGEHVRCLIHFKEERVAGAECVPGDITAPQSLTAVVQGVDIVYHLAGATVVTSPHKYKPINSLGTRNLAEACAGLEKPPLFMYLSSLAAAGPTTPNKPLREENPPAPVSEYGRSKLLGERFLQGLADRLPVTVLRPPGVFGPGDPNMVALFKSVRAGVNFVPGSRRQQLGFIYVSDLIEALLQAAEWGERLRDPSVGLDDPQGLYFVAMEERPTLEELGLLAASALGETSLGERHIVSSPVLARAVRTVIIPARVGKILARVNDFLSRLTMQPMLLTSDKMREALAGSWICSSEKAKRAWGFTCQTELAEGLRQTVAWYRHKGML